MHISRKLVQKLPKTDLHCHFDGSLRIETLIELAKKNNVELKSYEPASLMSLMGYGRVRKNLEEYLEGFDPPLSVLQKASDIERCFYELCEDAYNENIWHFEIRYCPYLHINEGLSEDEVIKACIRAMEQAQKDFNISVVQILCGLKHTSSLKILDVAKLAAKYKDKGVVGFDLAGPEDGYPIRDHLEAIYFAKRNHLYITLHAGESYGPESISQAIHDANAHRVGHGTSLIKDKELLSYVVNHRIGVEACPISNWHTQAVRTIAEHPIKEFLKAGVRVSVNTDNRLCSDTTVTEEIMALTEEQGLSIKQIKKLLENGFKSAFVSYNKRSEMLEEFNREWNKYIEHAHIDYHHAD